jgi:hypothetical protein
MGQGQWVHWIIPLIAVGVWILTQLLKAGSEQQQRRKQQKADGPRRPGGDIDRFLEEIQRRRRDGEKKRPPPEPVVRETPRPVKPPPLPPMPRRVERPVERVPPPRPVRTSAPRQVVPPPVEVVVLEEVKEVAPAIAEANVAPAERAAFRAPTVTAVRTPTPGAKMLGDLLRTQGGLQAAILMNEVIGPPKCKRPRHV